MSTSWVYWVPGLVPFSVTSKVEPDWNTAAPEKRPHAQAAQRADGRHLERARADRAVDVERAGENLDRAGAAEVDGSGRQRAVAPRDELADAVDEAAKLVGRGVGDRDRQAGQIAGGRSFPRDRPGPCRSDAWTLAATLSAINRPAVELIWKFSPPRLTLAPSTIEPPPIVTGIGWTVDELE